MRNTNRHSPILSILLAVLLPLGAYAQTAVPPANALPFTLKPLGHNVYAAIDDAKGDAGANAGFVIGDDGVLVIDTFENEAAAKQLLAEIRKLTKLPVKFVVNTHYHLDHVAGNAVFEEAGAVVMAQRNVFHWIHTENLKFFGKDIKPEQRTMVETLAAPKVLYDSDIQLVLGSREILVHVFPGHTGGDSVVMIPSAKVVFCGDLFWRKTLPNLIDASTEAWMETLEDLQTTSPSTAVAYVPGHGDPGDFHDVEAFRGYLADLRGLVRKQIKEGKTGDDLLNAVLPAVKEKYGQWNFFDYFAKPNIRDAEAELRGKKQIPQPAVAP
jgi:glyoxylase-like metal-dependent hydrolase (beta-lactamase superfamily II)